MKKITITSLTIAISLSALAGGGWTPQKGSGFFKFSQAFLRSNKFYAPNGDIIDIKTVSLYTTSLYGEYGLTDRLATIVYAPLLVRNTLNRVQSRQSGMITSPGDEVNALGDLDLGIKYALVHNKPIAVSVGLTLGVPTGVTQGGTGKILQTGDGEFNQLVKVDVSKSFYPKPIYVSVSTGFNNRNSGFSDEFHFGAEIGYSFKDKLTAIVKLYNVSSLKNGNASASVGNGIFSNNTEYLSYGPEINYKLKSNFGVSGSAAFAFSGKRILASPNYSLGVFITL